MSGQTVLIIEDEPDIRELVQFNLEAAGFRVTTSDDGERGVMAAKKFQPDLVLLDIMLPGIGGLDVCKILKRDRATRSIPIVILTAKGEESDIVVGLELGADDYVVKPFSPKELIARVRTVLRRSQSVVPEDEQDEKIAVGPVEIDIGRHEVLHRGQTLPLTLMEFRLLSVLVKSPGRVFTRDQLLEKINGSDTYVIDRNIDVHVRALRRKLGDDSDLLATVRGVGYKCRE